MINQTNINVSANFPAVQLAFANSFVKFCPQCGEESEMLATLDAADYLDVPIFQIYRRAESGEIHSRATRHGLLLVCRRSLQINRIKTDK